MYAPGVQAPPVSLVRVQSLPPAAYLPSVVFDESQDIRQQSAVKFFVTFNRTPAAMTIFNLLTAIQAESAQSDTSSVQIVGGGPLGPACLIARAMIPPQEAEKMPAVIDMNGWNGSGDEEYMNKLYLPMIQRIGGLEVVAAVAANGPIWLHNLGEGFDSSWIVSAGKLNGVEVKITRTPAAPQEINEWLSRYR